MIRCLHCNAETSNGLALCDLCQRKGATCLEFLPVHFRNLARQRRPGRPNGSLGMSGQWLIQRGETEGSKVQVFLERAMNDLTTWSRALADDRGVDLPSADTEAETVTVVCDMLDRHLTSIATLEWAGQFLRDIDRHERALSQLSQAVVPGWYAGECRQVTGRDMEGNQHHCRTPTYVMPGLTWVTCSGCGTTTYARDHLAVVLEEAADWIATPRQIAEAVVALVDTEQSVARLYERIHKWGAREKITPIRRTRRAHVFDMETETIVVRDEEVGFARYRFGAVLDRVLSEGATRIGAAKAKAS